MARVNRPQQRGDLSKTERTVPIGSRIECAGLVVDPERHEVWRFGEPVRLAPLEFKLLHYLMRHEGLVSTAQTLLEQVGGLEDENTNDAVKVAMARLRRKIEPDLRRPRWLHTFAGVGYIFRAD